MSKILEINNENGVYRIRTPFDPRTQKASEFDAKKMFNLIHESSPFFDKAIGADYIELKAIGNNPDDLQAVVNWLKRSARNGAVSKYYLPGRKFKFLYGQWMDKGTLILVEDDQGVDSLDDIGMTIIEPDKSTKYIKRLKAPHECAVFGSILDVEDIGTEQIVRFKLDNGYEGLWRNVELDSLSSTEVACVDGQGRVKPGFLKAIGLKARDLDLYSGKFTAFGPVGLGKGFLHAQSDLFFDLVTYGAKKTIRYNSLFFGILGSLKAGQLFYSDIQSAINFELFDYMIPEYEALEKEIAEYIHDPEKHMSILVKYLNLANVSAERRLEDWVLVRALKAGISVLSEPGLLRQFSQHILYELMDCEKGRVPFNRIGLRADIVPDPFMFDEYGNVTPANTVIPIGHMVCMDVPVGPTVEYRQPNGMALEASHSMNVHMRQFTKYQGKNLCFYGGDLEASLAPKNGADLDDAQCIIFEPNAVKHLRGLSYPVTDKMTIKEVKKPTLGRIYSILKGRIEGMPVSFGVEDFCRSLDVVFKANMNLGMIVLTIMLDTILSSPRHVEHMLSYLTQAIQEQADGNRKLFLLDCREWLAQREPFQLADAATNLEAIIDQCIQGKGDISQFKDINQAVARIRQETKVFPVFFGKSGRRGNSRISSFLLEWENYVLAPSLLCETLAVIESKRKQFLSELRAFEWDCITPVPEALEMQFGSSPSLNKDARAIRAWYVPAAQAALAGEGTREQKQTAYRSVLHGSYDATGRLVKEGLKQVISNYSLGDKMYEMFLAVELKRLVTRNTNPVIDAEGNIRQVPTGVFSNAIVFNRYIDALEEAGLIGDYAAVDFDREAWHLRSKSFPVTVTNGTVLRKDDGYWLGTSDVANGDYNFNGGLIEVKKPHPDLLSNQERSDLMDRGELEMKPMELNGEEGEQV